METIALITALLIAAGTIYSAIYQSRTNTEKTLQAHIEKLDKDIQELKQENKETNDKWQTRCDEFQVKYDNLLSLYEREKARSDRLEKKLKQLTKSGAR